MPVMLPHPSYSGATTRWKRNRDAIRGRDAIAAAGDIYLPRPDMDDTKAAAKRFDALIKRAQWYAAPKRTMESLVGAVFRKGPAKQEIPAAMEYLIEDADGAGQSLEQIGKRVLGEQLVAGGVGLLADYPEHDLENPSLDDVQRLGLRPRIVTYQAEQIINWRTETQGGRELPALIVLAESVDKTGSDIFAHDIQNQYRVLRLVGGVYVQELYDQDGSLIRAVSPRQGDGKPWTQIPFIFAGAQENKMRVQDAPLAALCDCAISYWQVSALYHENLAIHGQLTLGVMSDMSAEEWQAANPNGITVGAATGVFLGKSGGFATATAPESSSLSAALKEKRIEMAELGAQIVEKSMQQTAEAARSDAARESSLLAHVVGNCAEAIEQALEWCAVFSNVDPGKVFYDLPKEFNVFSLDPATRSAMQGELDRGLIAKSDYRRNLRLAGVIPAERTDEDIDDELAVAPPVLGQNRMDLNDGR